MYTVGQINKYLSDIAPAELSESWDNDGVMLCKSTDAEVKRVLVALEVRRDVIDYAAEHGFDLVVTHHPFIFRKLSRICADDYENLEKLMKNGISVLSYHTRLDSAEGGVNDALARVIGLKNIVPFGGETGNIGRMGTLENALTSEELAHLLKEKLGCDMRCTLADNGKISTVALVGGAGKDFVFDALALGAQAFVTSEVPHHLFIAAKESGFSLYDCGHYYTENPVCTELLKLIKDNFNGIYAECYDVKCPYTCIL